MPGALEMDHKMEKKKKSRRKRVAALPHQSDTDVAEVFTHKQAYSQHQHSILSGKKSPNVEAVVRDASTYPAKLGHKFSSSFAARNETNTEFSETPARRRPQESCIEGDGSSSDDSKGFGSLHSERSLRTTRGNGLAQIEAGEGRMKRKRSEDAVAGADSDESEFTLKTQKLSEEARVWQYVCRRSVFVSAPQVAKPSLDERSNLSLRAAPFRGIPLLFGQSNVLNDKTTYLDVVVNGKTIKVTVTKESNVAKDWIEQQRGKCFGLDLEWQPNRRKREPDNKVALMQISSEKECLLIQMLFLDLMPIALVQFLKDPERKIVGVGIHGDTKKLRRDFGLISGGEVELTTLAVAHFKNEELRRVGLKVLAKHVLGFDMNKSKTVTMSNWSKSHLDRRQVEYACIDAWISHAIYGKLQECPVLVA